MDSEEWDHLAKLHGIRLPQWHTPPTPGGIRRYLKRLGISVPDYLHIANESNLRECARLNPHWPLRAFVGMLLEQQAADSGVWRDDEPGDVRN